MWTLDITDAMQKCQWKAVDERRWHHWANWPVCWPEECGGDERVQLRLTADKQTSILTVFISTAFRKLYSRVNCSVRTTVLAVNRARGGVSGPGRRGRAAVGEDGGRVGWPRHPHRPHRHHHRRSACGIGDCDSVALLKAGAVETNSQMSHLNFLPVLPEGRTLDCESKGHPPTPHTPPHRSQIKILTF